MSVLPWGEFVKFLNLIFYRLKTTSDPYAFVEFTDHTTAAQALQAMNKRMLLDKV